MACNQCIYYLQRECAVERGFSVSGKEKALRHNIVSFATYFSRRV